MDRIYLPLDFTLDAVEREYILHVLERLSNNRSHTAKTLGISPRTLYTKLTRYKYEGHNVPLPNNIEIVRKMTATMVRDAHKHGRGYEAKPWWFDEDKGLG